MFSSVTVPRSAITTKIWTHMEGTDNATTFTLKHDPFAFTEASDYLSSWDGIPDPIRIVEKAKRQRLGSHEQGGPRSPEHKKPKTASSASKSCDVDDVEDDVKWPTLTSSRKGTEAKVETRNPRKRKQRSEQLRVEKQESKRKRTKKASPEVAATPPPPPPPASLQKHFSVPSSPAPLPSSVAATTERAPPEKPRAALAPASPKSPVKFTTPERRVRLKRHTTAASPAKPPPLPKDTTEVVSSERPVASRFSLPVHRLASPTGPPTPPDLAELTRMLHHRCHSCSPPSISPFSLHNSPSQQQLCSPLSPSYSPPQLPPPPPPPPHKQQQQQLRVASVLGSSPSCRHQERVRAFQEEVQRGLLPFRRRKLFAENNDPVES